MNKITIQVIVLMMLFLNGCGVANKSIRGVPAHLWQHLTAEQKQLIIDRSYEAEFEKK